MPRSAAILSPLVFLAACSGESTDPASAPPEREPLASEILVEAVDAGSRAALADSTVTVRYLVRTPIRLDAAAVEEVPASEPYRIVHEVATDSLVVELRLEAASYGRIDTVVGVERGATAGPVRIPMSLRADLVASAPAEDPDAEEPPTRDPPAEDREPAPRPAEDPEERPADPPTQPAESPETGVDWTALRAGDRAFQSGDWTGAAAAYRRMPAPPTREGEYAQEYVRALVRRGIANINLGDWQDALQALQSAVNYDFREYSAYFYLGQVQCTLGRFDAGRSSLEEVSGRLSMVISEAQRPVVLALVQYQLGMCGYGEFRQADNAAAARRAGQAALEAFGEFRERARGLSPIPPEVQAAMDDARQRVQEIQQGLG